MATGWVANRAFYLSMKIRLTHIGLFILLTLLGLVSTASAQKDTIAILSSKEHDLGSIPFGTTTLDSFDVRFAGGPRFIFAIADSGLTILSPGFPFDFKSAATVNVRLRVRAQKLGLDSLYLVLFDSVTSLADTALVIINGTQALSLHTNPDTVRVGKLLVGATVMDSFYVVNFGAPIGLGQIFTLDAQGDSVQLLAPLQVRLETDDSTLVRFLVRADALGARTFHFRIMDSTGKPVLDPVVRLEGISPSALEPSFDIDPSRSDVFAAVTQSDNASFEIYLKNNSDTALVINNVSFDSSPYYQLSYDPDTLEVGDSLLIKLDLVTQDPGFYRTNVRVPENGGLASEYTLGIQVLRIAPNSVPIIRTASGIRVTQSATDLAIENIPFETGSMSIYDLLGRELVQHPVIESEMFIPKLDASGSPLDDGCYIIRLIDAKGQHSEVLKVILLSY